MSDDLLLGRGQLQPRGQYDLYRLLKVTPSLLTHQPHRLHGEVLPPLTTRPALKFWKAALTSDTGFTPGW